MSVKPVLKSTKIALLIESLSVPKNNTTKSYRSLQLNPRAYQVFLVGFQY